MSRHREILLTVLVFILLAAVVGWVYRGVWATGFYKDDYLWLVIARDVAAFPQALFHPDPSNAEAVFRLSQRLTMAFVHVAFGGGAGAHHGMSLFLHAVVSTLVFRLLLRLQRRWAPVAEPLAWALALMGAMVFASTSVHSMAVAWISAQSGLFGAMFLCILLLYASGQGGELRRRGEWAIAIVLFLLALVSKHTVVGAAVGVMALGFFGAPYADRSRRLVRLGIVLGVLALVHLLVGRVLFGPGADAGNFALGRHVVDNVLGAVLAPVVSAADYASSVGRVVPFQAFAVLFLSGVLGLARVCRVHRPVAWSLLWMVVLPLPVCFMDYREYDPAQFSVNRYYYASTIGWVVALSFLVRACMTRLGGRSWTIALPLLLLLIHGIHHEERIQSRVEQLAARGEADRQLIEGTLDRARRSIRRGSTIYAVGWGTEDDFVRSIGQLYFAPLGYELRGEADFRPVERAYRDGVENDCWVAAHDAEANRLAVVPLITYMATR